ncbi:MAG: hypothetical protein ACXIUZ_02070 [Lysobacteraceae bacterium]
MDHMKRTPAALRRRYLTTTPHGPARTYSGDHFRAMADEDMNRQLDALAVGETLRLPVNGGAYTYTRTQ